MWKPRIRGEFVWNNSSPFGGSPRGNLWELKCWQPWSFPWPSMSFSDEKPLAMPNLLVKLTGAPSTRAETRIELAVTSKSCSPLISIAVPNKKLKTQKDCLLILKTPSNGKVLATLIDQESPMKSKVSFFWGLRGSKDMLGTVLWGQDAMLRSHRGRVRKATIRSAMSPWPQPCWSSLHCTAAKAVSFFKCHASPRHQKNLLDSSLPHGDVLRQGNFNC